MVKQPAFQRRIATSWENHAPDDVDGMFLALSKQGGTTFLKSETGLEGTFGLVETEIRFHFSGQSADFT